MARHLPTIVAEIRLTFRSDNNNIITRGKLFQEAKDRLEHGQWLPWLEENFHMTDKTAERAMAVARFADKFDNLSNLDLPKAVLYELSSGDYPDKVVKTVLKEAASGPIDIGRFYAIDSELNPPPPPSPPSPEEIEERRRLAAEWWAEREAEEKEADAILDGPPPDLPPPEILPPTDYVLSQFNQAIKVLLQLHTKHPSKFAAAECSEDEINNVTAFLQAIAAILPLHQPASSAGDGLRIGRQ